MLQSPNAVFAPSLDAQLANVDEEKMSEPQQPNNRDRFGDTLIIHSQDLIVGTQLDAGQFGTVSKGIWHRAPVAIKKLNDISDFEAIEKFKREAEIMMGLRSPYIIQLYGICFEKEYYVMVMELMPSGSLHHLLHSKKPLLLETRYQIASDIVNGIFFLHQKGILHRDLKSGNVLLGENYKAKIIDFGFSEYESHIATQSTKSLMGTPLYMAPEIMKRCDYSKATDIFAYGVVLWELITRKTPWKKEKIIHMALLCKWIIDLGKRLSIPANCPPALKSLMESAWEGNPEKHPTAGQAADCIQKIIAEAQIEAKTKSDLQAQSMKASAEQEKIQAEQVEKAAQAQKKTEEEARIEAEVERRLQARFAKEAEKLEAQEAAKVAEQMQKKSAIKQAECAQADNKENSEQIDQVFEERARLYRLAAEQGDAKAQMNLGICYYYGNGVDQNFKEAVYWYQLSAEQGVAKAQFALAFCCKHGIGVDRDPKEAVHWYRLAADLGDKRAQWNLACCYNYGKGIDQNLEEAVHWYQRAAEQGYLKAQLRLGYEYRYCNKDFKKAVYWYRLAAEQGDIEAQSALGYCYEELGTDQDIKEAVHWYRLAAERGDKRAQFGLGCCYEHGKGIDSDLKEAVHWYRLAAKQGDAEAQFALGCCYEHGRGVDKDLKEAVRLYPMRHVHRLLKAFPELEKVFPELKPIDTKKCNNEPYKLWFWRKWRCRYFRVGSELQDIDQELKEAMRLYRLAAEQGDARAQYNLGHHYERGMGVDGDLKEAVRWYRAAAEYGYAKAQWSLGRCYERGIGVDKDLKEAIRWYRHSGSMRDVERVFRESSSYELRDFIDRIRKEPTRWHRRRPGGDELDFFDSFRGNWVNSKDLKEAIYWYRPAAEQGDTKAQWSLGRCYEHGMGINQDLKEAMHWYRLSGSMCDVERVLKKFFELAATLHSKEPGAAAGIAMFGVFVPKAHQATAIVGEKEARCSIKLTR